MSAHSFLAIDLGAESGRTILGTLENGRVRLQELRRFPNGMLPLLGHYHWNIFRLFEEIKAGLKSCATALSPQPESIGIDTWGVDFGLLGSDGSILGLPYAYRDPWTDGMMEEVFARIPRAQIYELTGIQFMRFNSLFQLFAMRRYNSSILDAATDLLFMPDLFNYLLSGQKRTEFTIATTSQLYNPRKEDWEDILFEALRIPRSLMHDIVPPGTVVGGLEEGIAAESGLKKIPVIAVASHDTGSAVAAVPAEDGDWAYISSGTWSLMGIETYHPIVESAALDANFTNEGGVEGTFRFLKNITGLWLLQECRRHWSQERTYGYDELMRGAEAAPPFGSLIDVDDPAFMNPPDMPGEIRRYCERKGENAPASCGEYVRCILESLALKYRYVFDQLQRISSRPIQRIHVIGGGAQNRTLCRFTANATGVPVVAGPVEATAIGNILMQAFTLGEVHSLAEIRSIIRDSFQLITYEPEDTELWNSVYGRFATLLEKEHETGR